MVTIRDNMARTIVVVPQILGTVELVGYAGGSVWSVAKLSLQKLAELYYSHISKNFERTLDFQIKITAELKVLNGRVYAIYMAIITIIPFGGIYRFRQAEKEVAIEKLIDEGKKFAKDNEYTKAFMKFEEASKMGSVEAKYQIFLDADEYTDSERQILIKIKVDDVTKLLQEAADKEYPPAQHALGYLYGDESYHPPIKLKQDKEKAFKLITKAALQQYPKAMCDLGFLYEDGSFGETDKEKNLKLANYWYKKAMSIGSLDGQAYWANNLYNGNGVKADEEEAIRLLQEAHAKGNEKARDCLNENNLPLEAAKK